MVLDLPSESNASAVAQVITENLAGQDRVAQEDGSQLRLVRLGGQVGDVQVRGGFVAFGLETRVERLLTPRVEISKSVTVHLAMTSAGLHKTVRAKAKATGPTELRTCTVAALCFLIFPLGCTCEGANGRAGGHSLCLINRVLEETSELDTGRNRVSVRKGGSYPSKTNFVAQAMEASDTGLGISVVVELGKAESEIQLSVLLANNIERDPTYPLQAQVAVSMMALEVSTRPKRSAYLCRVSSSVVGCRPRM